MTVYQAKGYRKVLTMDSRPSNSQDYSYSNSYNAENPIYRLFSQYLEKGRYKLCLKYSNECFFILDLLERKLNDDQLTRKKVENTIAVYPQGAGIQSSLIKMSKENIKGFIFVRTRVNYFQPNSLKINRVRVFEESNVVVKISLTSKRDNSKPKQLEIQVFELKKQENGEKIEKKNKRTKGKKSKKHPQINQIKFILFNSFREPSISWNKKSQSLGSSLHTLQYFIESQQGKHLSLIHKEINLNSFELKTFNFFKIEPEESKMEKFKFKGNFRPRWREAQTARFKAPNPYSIILRSSLHSLEDTKEKVGLFLFYDMRRNKQFVWKSKITREKHNGIDNKNFGAKSKYHQDGQGIIVVTKPFLAFGLRCEYLDLQNLGVSSNFIEIDRLSYSRILKLVGVYQTSKQEASSVDEDDESEGEDKEPKNSADFFFCGGLRDTINQQERFSNDFFNSESKTNQPLNLICSYQKIQGSGVRRMRKSLEFLNKKNLEHRFRVVGDQIFTFTLEVTQGSRSITVEQLSQNNLQEIEDRWEVPLKQVLGLKSTIGEKFVLREENLIFKILDIKKIQNKENEEKELKAIDVTILIVRGFETTYHTCTSFKKSINLVLYLKLYLGEPKEDFSAEIFGGTGYHFSYKYFRCPQIPDPMIEHALMNREHSVVEIFDNVFMDVKQNELFMRRFDNELKDLYKMANEVGPETVLELLKRFLGLGMEHKELLKELGLKEILIELSEAGWKDGLRYMKELEKEFWGL